MAKKLGRILRGLKDYYSAPLTTTFKQFRSGLIYFSVGMIIIYLAQVNLQYSLKQELVTVAGVVLVAAGFLIAMMAQIRMIISRIVVFFNKK